MKKLVSSILIAAQVGASTPAFNPDSAAKRMLIEDGVDGKLSISTVEKAYGIYTKKDDLERAMWLALMKDPMLLEEYMGNGLARDVRIIYGGGNKLVKACYVARDVASFLAFLATIGLWSWLEVNPNKQIVINTNGK